jgi:hypothetical protein
MTSFVTSPVRTSGARCPLKRVRARWLRSTTIARVRSASYSAATLE